jgi:hypothetical protein
MSIFDLIDPDQFVALRRKIEAEREARIGGLLHTKPEDLRANQQFIAGLDWVIEQISPQREQPTRSIYEDDDC